jgi:hypothetical protein
LESAADVPVLWTTNGTIKLYFSDDRPLSGLPTGVNLLPSDPFKVLLKPERSEAILAVQGASASQTLLVECSQDLTTLVELAHTTNYAQSKDVGQSPTKSLGFCTTDEFPKAVPFWRSA